ncbi:MAG: RusA family crossover junction endodeoxyribonuclease [Solidesulfovibrio sp. DCME]|uniref:RusA family crossover junction endodeoxyribonuclease n=1 Tax=Solidesulfovibrio sp. DCME TaxID=3447380 RepID=UPI003D127EBA
MTKSLEIPMFQPRPRPKFKREGSNVVAYYDQDLTPVREALATQWDGAPLSGKVALEAEFRVALPKRVSKARRAAMLAGEIGPKCGAGKTASDYLRAVLDCLPGVVVQDDRNVVLITGRMCYAEIAGATLRVGEAQFLAM